MATIVCVHAHPDDEALLTGGTIARLSAEGHRVVLVVATDGSMGQPESVSQNPSRRDELRASAGLLGAARVAYLGYADSGHGPVVVMASRVLRPQRLGGSYTLAAAAGHFTPRKELIHRVNVRSYAGQKRAALRAHRSQLWPASRGRAARVFWLLTRLPAPVFGLLLGTEWFAEPGVVPGRGYRTHVLD